MRWLAIIGLALALGAPDPAHAQSAAQWSQLVAYVGKLANRMLEQQQTIERLAAENEQQRQTINTTIGALEQERCRIGRLSGSVKAFAVVPPASPAYPQWVDGVACIDLASPIPPFPVPLPAP